MNRPSTPISDRIRILRYSGEYDLIFSAFSWLLSRAEVSGRHGMVSLIEEKKREQLIAEYFQYDLAEYETEVKALKAYHEWLEVEGDKGAAYLKRDLDRIRRFNE